MINQEQSNMTTLNEAKRQQAIAEAHTILDQIENRLKAMSQDIKASKVAKAA